MRTVAQSEAIATLPALLDEIERQSVVISREGHEVGALVSMKNYELVRRANIKRFLELCDRTGAEIAAKAKEQGVPLEEVQRYLLSDED
jgi:PHD/YefM family antitoxin component YafN of YafNO toxin-antitoxin module